MIVVVFSTPGRDELTARTVAHLDGRGGASLVDCPKLLWWVGTRTPPAVPSGWVARWLRREPLGSVTDFFEMLRTMHAEHGGDVHVFEDDVIPCTNLVPYLARRRIAHVTSYFNPRRRPTGRPVQLTNAGGFDCSQALSFPAELVQRFADLGPRDLDDTPATPGSLRKGQDLLIHQWLMRWRLPMVWGPSLVQHEKGPRSNGQPRFPWLHDPRFVGEHFDAIDLVDEPLPSEFPATTAAPVLRARLSGRGRR